MKRISLALALAVIVCLAGGVMGAPKKTVGFSVSTLANPFFVSMKDAGEKRARELGIEMITLDAQDSPEKQISQVEDLIARKVDVLIVNPVDSNAITLGVVAANRAGIPVITVTRPSNGGSVAQHLDIDNAYAGKLVGEELAKVLGGKGKVAILEGIPGAPSSNQRQAGFVDTVKAYPGIKIVSSLTANYSREEGARVMEDVLQANPELDAVYAHNDEMALGAVRALVAARRISKVKVFGVDAVDDAIEAIRRGEMSATVKQQPELQMAKAVESAVKIMKGQKVEPTVIIPLVLVNNSNVDELFK